MQVYTVAANMQGSKKRKEINNDNYQQCYWNLIGQLQVLNGGIMFSCKALCLLVKIMLLVT